MIKEMISNLIDIFKVNINLNGNLVTHEHSDHLPAFADVIALPTDDRRLVNIVYATYKRATMYNNIIERAFNRRVEVPAFEDIPPSYDMIKLDHTSGSVKTVSYAYSSRDILIIGECDYGQDKLILSHMPKNLILFQQPRVHMVYNMEEVPGGWLPVRSLNTLAEYLKLRGDGKVLILAKHDAGDLRGALMYRLSKLMEWRVNYRYRIEVSSRRVISLREVIERVKRIYRG